MIASVGINGRSKAVAVLVGFCVLATLLRCGVVFASEQKSGVAGLSMDEVQRLGERIYRDGILPSGESLKAIIRGDILVEGTQFSCSSCHMRGGLGSYEGQVITLPTNGKSLYQPYHSRSYFQLSRTEKVKIPEQFRSATLRPAYTDTTLAKVIRGGVDPAGRVLDATMPRYQLDDRDMAILIAYLKELSSTYSPGVTDTTLRFATVIAGEVSPEDRAAMLVPLERYIEDRNTNAKSFERRRNNYGWHSESMDRQFRRLSLARWELKGPPETWRAQLEDYYRKEPVFALLGGISYGDWKPVHEFSEEHHIPCILPITDFPVISDEDWYTLYFSRGLYQEGETAAHYLSNILEPDSDQTVVQIVQDSHEGKTLAAGFEETWQSLGKTAPVTKIIKAGEALPPEFLQQLVSFDKPPILILWAGPETLPALESISTNTKRPEMVYISSKLIKQSLMKLPVSIRDFTYVTYPYRLPQEENQYSKFAKTWLLSRKAPVNDKRISTRMFSLMSLMTQALMHMKSNFYRDYFLDVISMFPDQLYPDYERLSFGPGQVYASKGCYIVQLTQGTNPQFVKKSDWVIH
jgi:hypothetical protein